MNKKNKLLYNNNFQPAPRIGKINNYEFDFSFTRDAPKDGNDNYIIGSYDVPKYNTISDPICVEFGVSRGGFIKTYASSFKKIYSFEAAYSNFHFVLEMIKQEKIDNSYIFNLAGSDKSGKLVEIYYPSGKKILNKGYTPNNCSLFYDPSVEGMKCHRVMSITIEDILLLVNNDKINYLKVDIEGGEYDLLQDKNLSCIDVIGIEIHNMESKRAKKLINHISKQFNIYKKQNKTNADFTFINKDLPDDYLEW